MLCLDSVSKAIEGLDAEIIVVDNHSEDDSSKLVKDHFPEVLLIENKENLGFSKANNIGVKKAKGEFICILNPDTVVPEDCFTNLIETFPTLHNPGAIGVQLVDGAGEFLEESKRNIPTPKVALKKLLGNCLSYYNYDLRENDCGPTNILVGAFMFMKKELYLKIGGFDEEYFMYGEDIDLSYRIYELGFQNYYLGSNQVLHFKGESTTKDQLYLKRFFNAMYIFYKKHFKNYKNSFRLVKLSLKLTMALEKRRLKSIKIKKQHYKNHHIISNEECLASTLNKIFNTQILLSEKANSEISNSLIVLDANHLTYKNCIQTLINLRSKNNAFRIKPRHHKFLIGSDSKYLKGEVLELS
jgi:GT2 family glycosyltransferase